MRKYTMRVKNHIRGRQVSAKWLAEKLADPRTPEQREQDAAAEDLRQQAADLRESMR